MSRLIRTATLATALFLTGCGSAFTGYDLAPNGLPVSEDALRRGLAFEAADVYRGVLEGRQALPDDDLLRLLYAGTAARYAGRYEESSRLLDLAGYVADDRVTRSVSREAISFLTSDRALAYTPPPTERLMIPALAALNYLDAGRFEEAAVEARRIEALLDRFDEGVPAAELPYDSRVLHYFAGAVFEAAGEWNGADVAYRRAGGLADSIGTARGSPPADSMGDVVVVVEHGFVPHRVEQSVVIVLPPAQAKALKDGDIGAKAAAALDAAARILVTAADYFGDRGPYYRDRAYHGTVRLEPWREDRCRRTSGSTAWCDEEDGENPYLLRISWPVLYQPDPPAASLGIRAGTATGAVARLDLSDGTRRDLNGDRKGMIARAVLRAAAKLALTAEIEDKVSEKDETAGEIVGALVNLGTLLVERADTRSWHLLPGSLSVARIRLPAGTHDLSLVGGTGSTGTTLGTIEVRPGRTTFLTTRLWR